MFSNKKTYPKAKKKKAGIVSRAEWNAEDPKERELLTGFPLPFLVFMHTNTEPCKNREECIQLIKKIQKKHMAAGAPDILHNYLISVDGTVYEGQGPRTVGMLYPLDDEELGKANKRSINVACIDNGESAPSHNIMAAAAALTTKLVADKFITEEVQLLWYDPGGTKDARNKRNEMAMVENFEYVKEIAKISNRLENESPSIFDRYPLSTVKRYFCRVIGSLCESCSFEQK